MGRHDGLWMLGSSCTHMPGFKLWIAGERGNGEAVESLLILCKSAIWLHFNIVDQQAATSERGSTTKSFEICMSRRHVLRWRTI